MKVKDIKNFDQLLNDAELHAANDFEMDFILDIQTRYDEYEENTFISESQLRFLEKIAKYHR